MKLTLAGRRSPVRATARALPIRYAAMRSYDEKAAVLALGATLLATVVLALCLLALRT